MNARALAALLGSSWLGLAGCSDVVGGVKGTPGAAVASGNHVDLLFVIDGSPGALEAQRVLARSVSEILLDLVNPRCVDALGGREERVATPTTPCPPGLERAYEPVASLNVGVISSSLGSLAQPPCDGSSSTVVFGNDKARLLTRGAEELGFADRIPGGVVSWRRDSPNNITYAELESYTRALITGVGDAGCPYPMPLEAMTRFLMDPSPYDHLELGKDGVTGMSVDATLLAQREEFLRDESVLAVFVLAPNGDCSVRPSRQSARLFSRAPGAMPRAASVCADEPENECCYTCNEPPPGDCLVDADTCAGQPTLAPEEDPVGMRCADQRRRFGASFLYPVARYANALQLAAIDRYASDFQPRASSGEPNPLFGNGRARDRVALAVVTGVPWYEIAENELRFEDGVPPMSALASAGVIADVAGDPDRFIPPTNDFQIESLAPREHVLPGNFTNGGDRPPDGTPQYACIYPLSAPAPSPRCTEGEQSPLCSGVYQTHAYAIPGARPITLAASLQDRAALASICTPRTIGESTFHYGYRPALRDLVARIEPLLVK